MISALFSSVSNIIGRGAKDQVPEDEVNLELNKNETGTSSSNSPSSSDKLTTATTESPGTYSVVNGSSSQSNDVEIENLWNGFIATSLVEKDPESPPKFQVTWSEDEDSDDEEGNRGEPVIQEETKRDVGQITNMESDFPYGYIDKMYRFNKATFQSKGPFHCFDMVEFSAVQRFDPKVSALEWVVEEMKPFVKPELKQILKDTVYKTRTLQVTRVIEKEEVIECADAEIQEKVPMHIMPSKDVIVGDWLVIRTKDIKVQGNSTCYGEYISAEFVRKSVRRGMITKWNPNYVVVDEDIIVVSPKICPAGTFPLRNTKVRVEYIDSDQRYGGSFRHRAISVTLRSNAERMHLDREDRVFPAQALQKLMEDKHGVVLSDKKVFFTDSRIGAKLSQMVTVQNTSNKIVYLKNVRIGNEQSICKFTVSAAYRECSDFIKLLEPDDVFGVTITCEPLQLGWTSDFCFFDFGAFEIMREVRVRCIPLENETLAEISKDRASRKVIRKTRISEANALRRKLEPFKSTERKQVFGIESVRRPFFLPKMEENRNSYKLPAFIIQACEQNCANLLYEHCPTLRPDPGMENASMKLTFENYKDMFHVALWFEEHYHLQKKQKFSLEGVVLERCGECYTIPFPGVKEAVPSFNYGDPLSLCNPVEVTGAITNTFIQRISEDKIYIKVDEAFSKTYEKNPLNIEFRIGRTAYKRCHFAVETAFVSFGESWLFPSEPLVTHEPRIIFFDDNEKDTATTSASAPIVPLHRLHFPMEQPLNRRGGLDKRRRSVRLPQIDETGEEDATKEVKLRWYNNSLNQEQKNAVKRILRGDARPIPYVIFGPPGTGKTVTVVEAVTQINRIDTNSRILVAAPSNAAADRICQYLIEISKYGTGEFVRLLGFNRADSSHISELIKPYCQDGDNIAAICKYRIIVCTCNSAGQFFQMDPKLSSLHISHVFVDEAGYCSEPDSLIPCLFVSNNPQAQVILAGDPKQLGPTVFDDSASAYKLEGSLLTRLMENSLYSRDKTTKQYNPLLVTKLVRNYRAHPEFLHFPSKYFYENELISSASEEVRDLSKLPFLPKPDIPMIFHGLRGEQAKDSDSPSWYNALEVMEVLEYVRKLLHEGCTVDDIGIITPYRKQVEKIRIAISMQLQCRLPKVGSVEEFQGGEKKVIILSLVRSAEINEEHEFLSKYSFVFNERRFNVSATRAKALFITIGNPRLFAVNAIWKKFIMHCIKKGVYIGCDLPVFLRSYYQKCISKKNSDESDSDSRSERGGLEDSSDESDY